MLYRSILLIILTFLLNSCATAYKQQGLMGGFSEIALADDTYQVEFKGNGFTPDDVVQNYCLRRCAEITISRGYKYFIVINGNTADNQSTSLTPAQVYSNANITGYGMYGGFANINASESSFIIPSQLIVVNKYKTIVIIKLLRSKDAKGALKAQDILNSFTQ